MTLTFDSANHGNLHVVYEEIYQYCLVPDRKSSHPEKVVHPEEWRRHQTGRQYPDQVLPHHPELPSSASRVELLAPLLLHSGLNLRAKCTILLIK